jgi:hypothetical protein
MEHRFAWGDPNELLTNSVKATRYFGVNVKICDGGWCDFADADTTETVEKIDRQVEIAKRFECDTLRLFVTRLEKRYLLDYHEFIISKGIAYVADKYPDMTFLFENHNDLTSDISLLCNILRQAQIRDSLEPIRNNIGVLLDICNCLNFGYGSNFIEECALENLDMINHVHIKNMGYPIVTQKTIIESLQKEGYTGTYGIEFEPVSGLTEHPVPRMLILHKWLNAILRGSCEEQ